MRRLILTNNYVDWKLNLVIQGFILSQECASNISLNFYISLQYPVYIPAPSSQANLPTFHLLVPLCEKERKSHYIQCEEAAYMLINCTTLKCNLIIFILLH